MIRIKQILTAYPQVIEENENPVHFQEVYPNVEVTQNNFFEMTGKCISILLSCTSVICGIS